MFRPIRPKKIKVPKREKSRLFLDINNYTKKSFNHQGILETPASFMSFFNGAIQEVYSDLLRPFKQKKYDKIKETKAKEQKQEIKIKAKNNYERLCDFKKKLVYLLDKIKKLISELRQYLINQRKDLNQNEIKEIEEEIKEWEFVADNVLGTFINFITNTIEKFIAPKIKKIDGE
jgi:hypothetical protein